jgi:DtxR family transcriptional regulator, Mn-dependent transcriptional regulator
MLSYTEENYLKTIYRLSDGGSKAVLTNEIAESMNTKAASVTDMIKKLSVKDLVSYEPYYGVKVTKHGKQNALMIIRKHRLWETFLVDKLHFDWGEVHDVAEQLEHIQSTLLIEKLDEFLGYPVADPHGHPIPDKNGKIQNVRQIPLAEVPTNKKCVVRSVRDGSASFLQYLSKIGIYIGATIAIIDRLDFDGSLEITIDNAKKVFISRDTAQNLLITE